jgi:hypothetical protein
MIKSAIKLISIISITFILVFSFVGQNLIVNAGTPAPTPTPGTTTTPTPGTTTTPKPATPAAKSDGPVIGGLKKCTVEKNDTFTPQAGNEKLRDCLKDIIQLVITIAVLISVASLVGYGIQLMNPLETSGQVQKMIATRITELAVGGVILGMFGTILATINPATLTTSQVFGQNAVENFRRYIGIGQGATNAGISKNKGGANAGTNDKGASILATYQKTDGSGTFDTDKIKALKDGSPEKKSLIDLVTLDDECTDLFSTEKDCVGYTPISSKTLKSLNDAGIKSTIKDDPNLKQLPGPLNTNYKIDDVVKGKDGVFSLIVNGDTTATVVKIRGKGTDPCKTEPKGAIEAGKLFIPADCSVEIVTKK